MRKSTRTLLAIALLAVCGASASYLSVTLLGESGPGYNLDQCANGTLANLLVPCGIAGNSAPSWQNGNLNSNNAAYREGDGIPYRSAITKLTTGTWTIRLNYDFAKAGVFAFDRLTRLNLTQ